LLPALVRKVDEPARIAGVALANDRGDDGWREIAADPSGLIPKPNRRDDLAMRRGVQALLCLLARDGRDLRLGRDSEKDSRRA